MSSKKIAKQKKVYNSGYIGYSVDLFAVMILSLFPLFFIDRYYNILQAKYYFYIASVVLMVVVLLITVLIKHDCLESYFSNFQWDFFLKKFTVTDIALLLFLSVAIISTISSDYVYESFWGNEGRYSGLFLLTLYACAYFLVTRFGKLKKWYLDLFLISGMLICLFGISDYFKMDLLHFKVGMREDQRFMFTSTIGNINTYTAFVGMVTAVSAVLFATEKDKRKEIFYLISLVISFFAIIMGISDNAYLSIAALLGLLPLYLFYTRTGAKRYLIIVASFFTVLKCISWINITFPEHVYGIDGAFNMIAYHDGLLLIIIGLWLIIALWYAADHLWKSDCEIMGNKLQIIWLILLILVILSVGYAFIDANINGNYERYGALGGYLVFNDEWGTHRGYIWRNAIECFKEFSPLKKIFGYGPDTFGILLLDKTAGNSYGEIYDNAHNEYIHYLITVGIAGLSAYLVYIISYVIRCVKKGGKNPCVIAAMMAVVCYSVQAFVNLNLPIATPVMWAFLSLGMLGTRENSSSLEKVGK